MRCRPGTLPRTVCAKVPDQRCTAPQELRAAAHPGHAATCACTARMREARGPRLEIAAPGPHGAAAMTANNDEAASEPAIPATPARPDQIGRASCRERV